MLESEAIKVAKAYLSDFDIECVIVQNRYEAGLGWLFFYQSKRHIETGELTHSLVGNAPFIISPEAEIIELGTAYPVEWYLAELRKTPSNA